MKLYVEIICRNTKISNSNANRRVSKISILENRKIISLSLSLERRNLIILLKVKERSTILNSCLIKRIHA